VCLKGKISFDAVKKEHIHDPMTLMWVISTRSINMKKFSTCFNIYDFFVHVHITHAPEQLFAFEFSYSLRDNRFIRESSFNALKQVNEIRHASTLV